MTCTGHLLRTGALMITLLFLTGCGESNDTGKGEAKTAAVPEAAAPATDEPLPRQKAANTPPQKNDATSSANVITANARHREVADPDQYILGWIYYDWSGMDPGIEAAAERSGPLRAHQNGHVVNQFNRQQFIDEEKERLQTLFAEGRNVGSIVMNLSGQLSEYDPGYGEYYIGPFTPGSTASPRQSASWDSAVIAAARARNDAHRDIKDLFAVISMKNALDAYVWKMSREEAVKLTTLMESEGNYGRNIYARTRLKILGTTARNAQGQHEIETQILSFTLFTAKGTRLASVDLVK